MGTSISYQQPEHGYDTRLMRAICKNDYTSVCYLISQKGADLNLVDNEQTALSLAMWKWKGDIVRKLLDAGCDVNAQPGQKHPPIFVAVLFAQERCLNWLLECGVDVNATVQDGITVLHAMAMQHKLAKFSSVFQTLIGAGANVNQQMNNGDTALFSSTENSHENFVVELLSAGADPCLPDNKGFAPLHIAAEKGDHKIVEILLKHKDIQVNQTSKCKQTPLHMAVKKLGNQSVMRLLVNAGGDVNAVDSSDKTPLITCLMQHGDGDTVMTLLQLGTDLSVCGPSGVTATMVAVGPHMNVPDPEIRLQLVMTLLEHSHSIINQRDKSEKTMLHHALELKNNQEVVQLLKHKECGIDFQDSSGRTPLYIASLKGDTANVLILLKAGADPNISTTTGMTPLYMAANQGNEAVMDLLLQHKASVNQCDLQGKSPVYVAARHGHLSATKKLINYNADLNLMDVQGRTPLFFAVEYGYFHIAHALINGGTDVNIVDATGNMALHMSVKFPKLDFSMITLLHKAGCDPVNLDAFLAWIWRGSWIPSRVLKEHVALKAWMILQSRNVKPLRHLCRCAIWACLGVPATEDHRTGGISIRQQADQLPLPRTLRNYVGVKKL